MKETGLEKIQCPVLRFGTPNCTVLIYTNLDFLTKASFKTLETWRWMDEYFLIDSQGKRYNLKDPEFFDPPIGLRRLVFSLSVATRPVRWKSEEVGLLSLDQIRTLILRNFDEYETVWQAYDLDELKRRLMSARSVGEVMAVFGN
ncbi:MAG: hypothetical protein ACFCU4_04345 [Puniceicoccaceae bacterium]